MLPTNPGGHAAYQDTFVSQFLKFYPDPFVLPKSTWDYIVQFWFLDLSKTDSTMQECYSVFGPEPRLPSCMLRSYLLALKLKVTSITVWCRMLLYWKGDFCITYVAHPHNGWFNVEYISVSLNEKLQHTQQDLSDPQKRKEPPFVRMPLLVTSDRMKSL